MLTTAGKHEGALQAPNLSDTRISHHWSSQRVSPLHHWSTPNDRSSRSAQNQSAWEEELSENPSIRPVRFRRPAFARITTGCPSLHRERSIFRHIWLFGECIRLQGRDYPQRGIEAASTSCGLGIVIRHVDRKMLSDRASPSWLVPNHLWSRRDCAADVICGTTVSTRRFCCSTVSKPTDRSLRACESLSRVAGGPGWTTRK